MRISLAPCLCASETGCVFAPGARASVLARLHFYTGGGRRKSSPQSNPAAFGENRSARLGYISRTNAKVNHFAITRFSKSIFADLFCKREVIRAKTKWPQQCCLDGVLPTLEAIITVITYCSVPVCQVIVRSNSVLSDVGHAYFSSHESHACNLHVGFADVKTVRITVITNK